MFNRTPIETVETPSPPSVKAQHAEIKQLTRGTKPYRISFCRKGHEMFALFTGTFDTACKLKDYWNSGVNQGQMAARAKELNVEI
jgi:hypothetical protein